jgi:tRNA1(Val) A37 N6-methylase TrmN6
MAGKITRRQLAEVAAGSAVVSLAAVNAIAQTPVTGQDLDKAARESHQENSAALAKFEIPISIEPAFQFKA